MKLKPGVSTTEFWTVASAGLIGTGLALLGLCDGDTVVVASTILGAVYTALRAGLKRMEALRNPEGGSSTPNNNSTTPGA